MRWFLLILATSLLQLAQALTVKMRHTHGVFYPDVKQQAVLQLKITGEPGEKITKLEFSDGKTTQTSNIQIAYLSTSGGWNGYTLNTNKLAQEKGKAKPDKKGKFSFEVDIEVGSVRRKVRAECGQRKQSLHPREKRILRDAHVLEISDSISHI